MVVAHWGAAGCLGGGGREAAALAEEDTAHLATYHPSPPRPTLPSAICQLPPLLHLQLQTPSLTPNTPAPSLPGVTHLFPGHNINNTYNDSGTLWAS